MVLKLNVGCSQGVEGFKLFVDDMVLLVSLNSDLQLSLGLFAAESEMPEMRILQVRGHGRRSEKGRLPSPVQWEIRPQVEFMNLGFLFVSKSKLEQEIDRRIGAASAVFQVLNRSVVKKELSELMTMIVLYRTLRVCRICTF